MLSAAYINSYDFSSLNSNTNAAINNTSDAIKMMQNSMNGITDTVGVFLGDIDKDMNSAAVSMVLSICCFTVLL